LIKKITYPRFISLLMALDLSTLKKKIRNTLKKIPGVATGVDIL